MLGVKKMFKITMLDGKTVLIKSSELTDYLNKNMNIIYSYTLEV